jgi:hypothetical protein
MEGRWDDFAVGAAPPQGRYYGRRSDGGESDGSSGGVELSLRLRTGSSPPAPAAEQQQEATAPRSMTIFYNGRVCAVDVTEIQVIIGLMMIRPLAFAATRVYDVLIQYSNLVLVNNLDLVDRVHIHGSSVHMHGMIKISALHM